MPIYQQLSNFDREFNSLREIPIIINDLVNNSKEDKDFIKNIVTTRYDGDLISLLPSCRCGSIKGEFSIGVTCPTCNTLVKTSLESDIESMIWFRKPHGVAKLINPHVWLMLRNRFTKSGFNVIQWLTDTTYKAPVKEPPILAKLKADGVPRGYNNFVQNFRMIMEYLFSIKQFDVNDNIDYLKQLLLGHESNLQYIFSDYIPLPNKSILIIETTNVGIYVDPVVVGIVDAIEMLVSIDNDFYDQSIKVKENRTVKAIVKLVEYFEKYLKTNLTPKGGQLRRHVFGTRTNFSFRAVVSSLTGPHEYDEIHVPIGIGLTAFRPHLLNKLFKLGYDHNSAIGLLLSHTEKYHPLLSRLLQELIDESPDKGLKCLLQRNPSLMQSFLYKGSYSGNIIR